MDLFASLTLLSSLQRLGSTTAVATRHRIGQSTVSKRLAALQDHLGYAIIERDGRNLRLTQAGERLVEQALPISRALQDALQPKPSMRSEPLLLSVGVAESILSTWGASLLRSAQGQARNLRLALHSHRGPIVLERVISGDYRAGILAGSAQIPKGLEVKPLGKEPMVIIHPPGNGTGDRSSDAAQASPTGAHGLISIEEQSGTWQSIAVRISRYRHRTMVISTRVESFLSAAAMCEANFGSALVPLGVARLIGVKPSRIEPLPGVDREVVLVCRKRTVESEAVQRFATALQTAFPKMSL